MIVAAALMLVLEAQAAAGPSAICSNNSVFEIKPVEQVTIDQVGVEHAGYTVTTVSGPIRISDSGIFARWRNARRLTLPSGQTVLKRGTRGVSYAFPGSVKGDKPYVVVSGAGLAGSRADFELLDRIHILPEGLAEKDARCGQVLHYGWENILGPMK